VHRRDFAPTRRRGHVKAEDPTRTFGIKGPADRPENPLLSETNFEGLRKAVVEVKQGSTGILRHPVQDGVPTTAFEVPDPDLGFISIFHVEAQHNLSGMLRKGFPLKSPVHQALIRGHANPE